MPRRFRRPAAAALGAALLIPALAACGSSSGDDSKASSSTSSSGSTSSTDTSTGSTTGSAAPEGTLSQVSFTGDVGKSLKATWTSTIDAPSTPKATTLVKGSGDTIADGDTVSTYLYLGDATTKKDVYSDYTNGAPESIPVNSQLGSVFSTLLAGATYGSRVAVVTSAADLFGANGNSQLGIGAKDSLVVVGDLVKKAAASPDPTDDKVHDVPASKLPKVVETKGQPSGFDWTGIAKPALTTPVQRTILKQGTGAAVKATDTLTVNYLGETYQAKTPFDASYGKTPLTSQLSGLIKGWAIGLTGVKVGSQVLLQIPPALAYGADGSGSTIPGNATLWFVIDVVSAKSAS